jgi:hypothetical protein
MSNSIIVGHKKILFNFNGSAKQKELKKLIVRIMSKKKKK